MWYIAHKITPDLDLLGRALHQQGPWAGEPIVISMEWVREHVQAAIRRIDWAVARDDVQRFLPLAEQEGLRAWCADFFLQQLSHINDTATKRGLH